MNFFLIVSKSLCPLTSLSAPALFVYISRPQRFFPFLDVTKFPRDLRLEAMLPPLQKKKYYKRNFLHLTARLGRAKRIFAARYASFPPTSLEKDKLHDAK